MSLNDDLSPNTLIDGRYRVEGVLGAGGMGTVYAARHEALGRRVALKVLRREYAERRDVVERFEREARTVAQLGHDHICDAIDFGSTDGLTYYVMPLLEGAPLASLMASGELTLGRIAKIATQVLLALEETHDRHIVHRDLKPDNIFITRTATATDCVKLLDFGISKVVDGASSSPSTTTLAILGTPRYMAPEQAMGARNIGPRADLYSLGVVLYQAASGRFPFDGDNVQQILYHIMTSPLVPLQRHNPRLPEEFRAIVQRAMARDPAARFASAVLMRQDLERLVALPDFPADLLLPATTSESTPASRASEQSAQALTVQRLASERSLADESEHAPPAATAVPIKEQTPRRWGAMIMISGLTLLIAGGGVFAVRMRTTPGQTALLAASNVPAALVGDSAESAAPAESTQSPPGDAAAAPAASTSSAAPHRIAAPIHAGPVRSSAPQSSAIHGRYGTSFESSLP